VFYGMPTGRENMHPVDAGMVDFLTDHFQNRSKIDISDKIAIPANGLSDSLGGDGVYFHPLLVDEIFSLQKDDFKNRILVFKYMIIKTDPGTYFDHTCFRQSAGKLTKVFLIGESIGNVVEQRRENTLAIQEFYVRDNLGEMVP